MDSLPRLLELKEVVARLAALLESPLPHDAGWCAAYGNCLCAIRPYALEPRTILKPELDMLDPVVLMEHVLDMVAAEWRVPRNELLSKYRMEYVCLPRFAVMWILRHLGKNLSLQRIGLLLHRDHGSILNGINRCRELMETDAEYARKVHTVMSKIQKPKPVYSQVDTTQPVTG